MDDEDDFQVSGPKHMMSRTWTGWKIVTDWYVRSSRVESSVHSWSHGDTKISHESQRGLAMDAHKGSGLHYTYMHS
jgi:hypothetical protein